MERVRATFALVLFAWVLWLEALPLRVVGALRAAEAFLAAGLAALTLRGEVVAVAMEGVSCDRFCPRGEDPDDVCSLLFALSSSFSVASNTRL
jgi:hypothetical protein